MIRNTCCLLTLLAIICVEPAFSQDIFTGINYSIGSVSYTRHSDDLKTNTYLLNRSALVVEFSPFFSNFTICSGLEYQVNKFGNALSVPLTMRLAFGKKIRPFLEGGAFYIHSLRDKDDQYILKNDLGAKAGIGAIYQITKRWWVDAGYYRRFGFNSGLEEEVLLPLEQTSIERYDLKEGTFSISLKYRF